MYVLSAWNDCFEILSSVLTLHAAHLSSSLQVVWYGGIYHKPIFMLSLKIEKWGDLQTSSGILSESFNLII